MERECWQHVCYPCNLTTEAGLLLFNDCMLSSLTKSEAGTKRVSKKYILTINLLFSVDTSAFKCCGCQISANIVPLSRQTHVPCMLIFMFSIQSIYIYMITNTGWEYLDPNLSSCFLVCFLVKSPINMILIELFRYMSLFLIAGTLSLIHTYQAIHHF